MKSFIPVFVHGFFKHDNFKKHEIPIRMNSYPTRMKMMGILPKFGTDYLTFEN
jgi:hypothetical protein